jgi:monofunctional biosynthetic peptidoglycan transglycosylase
MSKTRITAAIALLALFGLLLYQFGLFIMVIWLKFNNPNTSAFMRATLTELQADAPKAHIDFVWVPYDRISANLKRAVVASEDSNFTGHGGVEWDAIRRALEYNLQMADEGRSRMRGGSTISQQLAKNLFLSSDRSYLRKGQELILTYMIEAVMSKRRILELYLNVAQWGVNVFGAQAAAKHYFKRDAAQLTSSQAARLAAMLPNPAYYDKRGNTSYLQSRTATLLRRMRQVTIP